MKKRLIAKVLVANALLWGAQIGWLYQKSEQASASLTREEAESTVIYAPEPEPVIAEPVLELPAVSAGLPSSTLLAVPFSSQAPYNDWNMPYQEACEEMSLLMIDAFLHGQTLDATTADTKIKAFTEWVSRSQLPVSITAQQTALIAGHYLQMNLVVRDASIEAIKQELAAGRPVIIPAAGKMLQNPFFTGEGPAYHMLVIIGYNETDFITNDPGTALGYQFSYPQQHLLNAIHDWTGSEATIGEGAKVMLVLDDSRGGF